MRVKLVYLSFLTLHDYTDDYMRGAQNIGLEVSNRPKPYQSPSEFVTLYWKTVHD